MAILTLAEAKEAARVDGDDQDLLIQAFIDAAGAWVARVTGKPMDPAPEDVKQAARMLIAYWYDQRGAAAEKAATSVPFGVAAMLAPHRSFAHGYVPPEPVIEPDPVTP